MTERKANKADEQALKLAATVLRDLSATGRSDRIGELSLSLDRKLSVPVAAYVANLLTHHHFQVRDYETALSGCRRWMEIAPQERAALTSMLSILVRLKRFDEVVELARRKLTTDPDNFHLHSALAHALGRLGRMDDAREHGTRCLQLKDASSIGAPINLTRIAVPPFDPAARARNVIAFSLYGDHRTYLEGAVRNAVAAPFLYPEWTCRFFVDASVPAALLRELAAQGAEVKRVDGLPAQRFGTFWRLLVADDPNVDRFLIRDCDACLNLRERAAVEDWVETDRHFHVMRDAITHTELILAGMWGGVRGALPRMDKAMSEFAQDAPLSRTADQQFLREWIWPTVRQSALVHDSHFTFGASIDFPPRAPSWQHVGQAVTRAAPTSR